MKRAPTLTSHLLAWVLGALVLVWGSFMVVGYRTGEHEADELTDGHLASVAALMANYAGGEFVAMPKVAPPTSHAELRAHDYQQSLSVVVWDKQGRLLTRSGDAPLPPFLTPDGFSSMMLGSPAQRWRAFTRWNDSRERKLMVLLSEQERDDLAEDIAQQVIEPGLWLLPVIALVLGFAIRRGLRPLYGLSRDVLALDIHKGQPLQVTARHEELRSAADAINTLVQRYQAALTRERALASEFAHELRTPLASLALQARALREASGAELAALSTRIEMDSLRAGEVLSHLLALARASRAELDEAAQDIDVADIARGVVAAFAPTAVESGHELGLAGDESLVVKGHPVLLEIALRNLVENALSHTPAGTEIEVRIDARERRLEVVDDATEAADGRRSLGFGLGHRVVEKIAAVHAARFEALSPPRGHAYRITFTST